jgi:branched-chain amino acid transport system substrate-binding protein
LLVCVGLTCFAGASRAQSGSEGPVRIGVLNDMNGFLAASSGPGSLLAAQMAVQDFGGKVLGRPVEVLSGNHQNKPDIGSAIAREWVERENVRMIVDIAHSAVALAVQELARDKHTIVMHGVTGTTAITQQSCAPTAFSWSLNAHALSASLPKPLMGLGLTTYFFIYPDYAFGHSMRDEATKAIEQVGGQVLGMTAFPQNTHDFSSYLLKASASKAKVIWLITAGDDTNNAIKQVHEFGLLNGERVIVTPLLYVTNVNSLGLPVTHGLRFVTPFYWDRTLETRAWANRFMARHKAMPTMDQAAVYSATRHYLRAVEAAGTLDGLAVADKIRELPVDDFYAKGGRVRDDGWLMHDFYLVRLKEPKESKGPWDFYDIYGTIPAEDAAQPLSESKCPLVKRS